MRRSLRKEGSRLGRHHHKDVGKDEKLGKERGGRRDEGSEMNPDQVQKRKSISVFMGVFSRKSKIHG